MGSRSRRTREGRPRARREHKVARSGHPRRRRRTRRGALKLRHPGAALQLGRRELLTRMGGERWVLATACLAASAGAAAPNEVVVRRANSVALGDVRVTVHSPAMLRAEWARGGAFEDRPSVTWLNRSVSSPFSHSVEDGVLVVRTSRVELRYDPATPAPASALPPAAPPCSATPLVPGSCFEAGRKGKMTAKAHAAGTADACRAACCADSSCAGFSFLTSQSDPSGGPTCPEGQPCCWLKYLPDGSRGVLHGHTNCTAGIVRAGGSSPAPFSPVPRFGPGSLSVSLLNGHQNTVRLTSTCSLATHFLIQI